MTLDETSLRALAHVLRNLDHPQRLRQAALTAHFFGPSGAPEFASDECGLRLLRATIDAALEQLAARARTIVRRCDFGGERHVDVAGDLGISVRHFYRERRAALRAIAAALRSAAAPRATVTGGRDALNVTLGLACALEQVGRAAESVALLERTLGALDDPRDRALVRVRLAEICADAGDDGNAELHASAVGAGHARDASDRSCAAQGLVVRALVMRVRGAEVEAEALASRALIPLRGLLGEAPSTHTREAFAQAAIVVAQRCLERGARRSADDLCTEALAALAGDPRTRAVLAHRAARVGAFVQLYDPARADGAVATLARLLAGAISAGALAEAGRTATTLAGTYRAKNMPFEAIATLEPMLDTLRAVLAGESLAGALLELAYARAIIGDGAGALDLVAELRLHTVAASVVGALSLVVEGTALLAVHRPPRALHAARLAVERLSALRRHRYIGSALRTQALALEAMGDLDGARTSIAESLAQMEVIAHPNAVTRARADARRLGIHRSG